MTKLKTNFKYTIFVLLIVMLSTFIFAACTQLLILGTLTSDSEHILDRIIYTTDVAKYTNGKNIIDEESIYEEGGAKYYVIEREDKKLDVVIDAKDGLTYFTDTFIHPVDLEPLFSAVKYTTFTNQYLFSLNAKMYKVSGEYVCDDPDCTSGASDTRIGDAVYTCNCLEYRNSFPKITSPTQLSDEELYADVCRDCWRYDESFKQEEYVYIATNICSHGVHYLGDGNYDLTDVETEMKETGGNEDGSLMLLFKELIIDGFDFSIFSNQITSSEVHTYHPNYEEYIDASNFSHMFYGLYNVEKITINNVTGLENAKNLSHMFDGCLSLKTVEFGNFFEEMKPTDISYMFYDCPNLEYLDLSTLDTSLVTNMSNMFYFSYAKYSNREEYLMDVFNTEILPIAAPVFELDLNKTYTIEELAPIFKEQVANESPIVASYDDNEIVSIVIMSLMATQGNYNYPLSWNEFVLFLTNFEYDMDSTIEAVNLDDPSLKEYLEFPPKEDGSPYTEDDIIDYLKTSIAEYGIPLTVVNEEEVDSFYNPYPTNEEFKLILGGNNSKFVIKDDTNVEDMFNTVYNFAIIVAPTIEGDIKVKLPISYLTNNEVLVSELSNKTNGLSLYVPGIDYVPPTPPVDPDPEVPPVNPDNPTNPDNNTSTNPTKPSNKSWIVVVISIAAALVVIGVVATIVIVISKKNTSNKESLDKESLDEESLDEEPLDEEPLDKEPLDKEPLDEDSEK